MKKDHILGGDVTKDNGTGGESIYGMWFPDENFKLKHSKPGILSMRNSGKNTNGSKFCLSLAECPKFNGKQVVFGEILEGQKIL